jgi:hypothetical protein
MPASPPAVEGFEAVEAESVAHLGDDPVEHRGAGLGLALEVGERSDLRGCR